MCGLYRGEWIRNWRASVQRRGPWLGWFRKDHCLVWNPPLSWSSRVALSWAQNNARPISSWALPRTVAAQCRRFRQIAWPTILPAAVAPAQSRLPSGDCSCCLPLAQLLIKPRITTQGFFWQTQTFTNPRMLSVAPCLDLGKREVFSNPRSFKDC